MITIYLDFDGVLVTKFSEGTAFDPVCVEKLKEMIQMLKTEFQAVRLCVISNWRFEKSQEEIANLLVSYRLLEDIEELVIPVNFHNREREILTDAMRDYFVIFDDDQYENSYLRKYLIRLRTEDGLRGIEDVLLILKFF